MNSNKKKFLMHGVTGSGKTEIYMNLVSYMLKDNKQSIILNTRNIVNTSNG